LRRNKFERNERAHRGHCALDAVIGVVPSEELTRLIQVSAPLRDGGEAIQLRPRLAFTENVVARIQVVADLSGAEGDVNRTNDDARRKVTRLLLDS